MKCNRARFSRIAIVLFEWLLMLLCCVGFGVALNDFRGPILDVPRSLAPWKKTTPTGVHGFDRLRSGCRAREDGESARVDVAPGQRRRSACGISIGARGINSIVFDAILVLTEVIG
jgi:hypothetical protein